MAVSFPQTKEDLLTLYGVGGVKLKKYGDIFFDLIHRYRQEQQGGSRQPVRITAVPDEDSYPGPKKSLESPPRKKTPPSGKQRHQVIGDAYNIGKSIEVLMEEFGIKEETVINYLRKYLQEGNPLRSAGLLSRSTLTPELQARVMEQFEILGAGFLAPVYNALNGQVGYPELRILQVYYLSCKS